MEQRIPKTIYSKEFREQAVKQLTEEGLSGMALNVAGFNLGALGNSGTDRKAG